MDRNRPALWYVTMPTGAMRAVADHAAATGTLPTSILGIDDADAFGAEAARPDALAGRQPPRPPEAGRSRVSRHSVPPVGACRDRAERGGNPARSGTVPTCVACTLISHASDDAAVAPLSVCGTRFSVVANRALSTRGEQIDECVMGCECSAFPIVAGIPVLIADDATRAAMHALEAGHRNEALQMLLGLAGDAARADAFHRLTEAGGPRRTASCSRFCRGTRRRTIFSIVSPIRRSWPPRRCWTPWGTQTDRAAGRSTSVAGPAT